MPNFNDSNIKAMKSEYKIKILESRDQPQPASESLIPDHECSHEMGCGTYDKSWDEEWRLREENIKSKLEQPATQSATEDKPLEVTDVIKGQEPIHINYDETMELTPQQRRVIEGWLNDEMIESRFTDEELERATEIASAQQSAVDTKLLDFLDSLPVPDGHGWAFYLPTDGGIYRTAREAIYHAMVEAGDSDKLESETESQSEVTREEQGMNSSPLDSLRDVLDRFKSSPSVESRKQVLLSALTVLPQSSLTYDYIRQSTLMLLDTVSLPSISQERSNG
jgi:hypothetical protein